MSKKVENMLRVVQSETTSGEVAPMEENLDENIIEVTQDELAFLARNGHQVKFLYNDSPQPHLPERTMCYDENTKQLSLNSEQLTQMLSSAPSEGSTTTTTTTVEVGNNTLDPKETIVQETVSAFNESGKKVVEKIDKNDPRSRLHFIKYVKKEGTTIKYWECGICGKEFKHQYTLMRHLPIHTDERNYKCDVCGLSFRQLSTLKQHKMRHSDAKPYVCEICQKTFSRVSVLISHKQIHSEEKRHQCPLCSKAFRQKGNLKTHVNVHLNSRPWKCDVCGEGFNQKSNLAIHRKTTHLDEGSSTTIHSSGIVEDVDRTSDQIMIPSEQVGLQLNSGQIVIPYPGVLLKSEPPRPPVKVSLKPLPQPPSKPSKPKSDDIKTYFGNSRGCAILTDNAAIIVNPIETKAMAKTVARGQTPYALLKPARGAPVLVKVLPAPHGKHMLVPANADDLAYAGTVSGEGRNGTVQLKVPVVATVIQRVRSDGTISITIEPPGTKEDIGENDEEIEDVEDKQSEIESSESLAETNDVMARGGDVMIQSGDFSVPEYVIYSGDQENQPGGLEMVDAAQQDQQVIYVDQSHDLPGDARLQQIMVEGEINHQIIVEGEINQQMMVEGDSNQTLYFQNNLANAVIYLQQDRENCQEDQEYLQQTSYQLVADASRIDS